MAPNYITSKSRTTRRTDQHIYWGSRTAIIWFPSQYRVRNRVVEINRFKTKKDWFYIQTISVAIAELGTRRGTTIVDVIEDSE